MQKLINEGIQKAIDKNVPIGTGRDYYGSIEPENYLFADGRAISRTDYADLFAIIGTKYGAGDGSTTFNLPDKRERVSVMYKSGSSNGTSGATLGTLGAKGGEFKHKITQAELPAINLEVKYDSSLPIIDNKSANTGYESSERTVNFNANDTSSNSHLITDKLGSGTAMNNMQPYLVCNYIIKVK
jgi:microcystin-dependent protein